MRNIMISLAAQRCADDGAGDAAGDRMEQAAGGGANGAGMLDSLMQNTERGRHALREAMNQCMLQCYLNVPSIMVCREGVVCITVSCSTAGAKDACPEVRNVFVAPQDLHLPKDSKQWDAAIPYICI
jgi:hypothetical protein